MPNGDDGRVNSWIERAQHLADEVLAPHAAAVDRTGEIPRTHFDALAAAGFYGITMADDLDATSFTEVGEILVAACLPTTFVWAQHLGVSRRIANSPNHELRDRLTVALRDGRTRTGVSYAGATDHPTLIARRVEGGYLLDGTAPFVTGWGFVDVIGVLARDEADPNSLISVLIPAEAGPHLQVRPIPLAAADASRTVVAEFDGLPVPDTDVDNRISLRSFNASTILATWRNASLALGIVRRCVRELDYLGVDTGSLVNETARIRTELDAALSGQADIYQACAAAADLAVRSAGLLFTATGSAAAVRGSTAERSVREAAFTLVFGSRPPLRAALLDRLSKIP